MSALKLALPVTVAMAGLLFCTSITYGTPEFAKKEKKACNTCHTKVSSDKAEMAKSLTPTGTCYRDNDHSLAKCTK
jgi:hypothetical protein